MLASLTLRPDLMSALSHQYFFSLRTFGFYLVYFWYTSQQYINVICLCFDALTIISWTKVTEASIPLFRLSSFPKSNLLGIVVATDAEFLFFSLPTVWMHQMN